MKLNERVHGWLEEVAELGGRNYLAVAPSDEHLKGAFVVVHQLDPEPVNTKDEHLGTNDRTIARLWIDPNKMISGNTPVADNALNAARGKLMVEAIDSDYSYDGHLDWGQDEQTNLMYAEVYVSGFTPYELP